MNRFQTGCLLLFCAMVFLPSTAEARTKTIKKVFSPVVQKSGLIFEGKAVLDFDSSRRRNNRQNYRLSVGEGISSMWWTEAELEYEKAPQKSDIEAIALEWRNIVQVTEEEEFMDVAVLLSYEIALEEGAKDHVEWGLLAQKQVGSFLNTANLVFFRPFKWRARTDGGFSWSTIYLWDRPIKPGFEYYVEDIRRNFPDDQQHYIGPVMYGTKNRIFYEAGILVGITDRATDAFLKFNVGYVF